MSTDRRRIFSKPTRHHVSVLPTADQLKELRQTNRLTLEAMGNHLGIPWERYKNYEYGRARFPADLLPKLKTLGWPNGDAVEPVSNDPALNKVASAIARGGTVTLPTITSVFAGSPEVEETFDDEMTETDVPALFFAHDPEMRGDYLALITRGKSMMDRIVPDDVLIVKREVDLPYGVLTAAQNADLKRFVKVLRRDSARDLDVLESVNGRYPRIENLANWTVIGGLVGLWRRSVVGAPNLEYDMGRWLRA